MTKLEFKTYFNCDRPNIFRFYTLDGRMLDDMDGWSGDIGVNEMFSCFKEQGTIVMEYIGVNDCNNTKIFEGDIVEEPLPNGWFVKHVVVKYYASFMTIVLFSNTNKPNPKPRNVNFSFWGKCKVIGNIHQNPELLRMKND